MVYNILIVASKMKSAEDRAARSREVSSNAMPPNDGEDPEISHKMNARRAPCSAPFRGRCRECLSTDALRYDCEGEARSSKHI